MTPLEPCYTAHLFRPLSSELVSLLRSLSPEEWLHQTLAPKWKVRDVAAHMLDTTLRRISVNRDGYFAPAERPPADERELVALITELNAGGVSFAARLSPELIVDLLEFAGARLADVFEAAAPHERAVYAVSWAGEAVSENWMDIGRDYAEYWHHQMQIREATARPRVLLESHWMQPLLDIAVRALPHAYRDTVSEPGTSLTLIVSGTTSGAWTLTRDDRAWQIGNGASVGATTVVRTDADTVWRLLFNAPYDAGAVSIEGDAAFAAPLLKARSVIV